MPSSVFDPTKFGQSSGGVHDRSDPDHRSWVAWAVRPIEADSQCNGWLSATTTVILQDGTWVEPAFSAVGMVTPE